MMHYKNKVPQPMNLVEEIAKNIIEQLIPGSLMQFQAFQSNSEHDFNLVYADGGTVPLEVTEATDGEWLKQSDWTLNQKYGRQFVVANRCKNTWIVHRFDGSDLKLIRKKVDQYLADIEAAGLQKFYFSTDYVCHPSVRAICEHLGIEAGRVFKTTRAPCIVLGLQGQSGTYLHLPSPHSR